MFIFRVTFVFDTRVTSVLEKLGMFVVDTKAGDSSSRITQKITCKFKKICIHLKNVQFSPATL